MPKFYFAMSDDTVLDDTEGTDLPDVDAARRHAKVVAAELMHHRDSMLGQPWSDWTMIVKDDKGEKVLSFRVSGDVESARH
jgi:hypothetical protein